MRLYNNFHNFSSAKKNWRKKPGGLTNPRSQWRLILTFSFPSPQMLNESVICKVTQYLNNSLTIASRKYIEMYSFQEKASRKSTHHLLKKKSLESNSNNNHILNDNPRIKKIKKMHYSNLVSNRVVCPKFGHPVKSSDIYLSN